MGGVGGKPDVIDTVLFRNVKQLSDSSVPHSFGKLRKLFWQVLFLILHPLSWLKPRCFSKDWDVTEYGVCELIDVISEIPDTTVCLSQQENEMVISIPKRGT